jgi:SAM-dependent methyltransferase
MNNNDKIYQFTTAVSQSLSDNSMVQISLGNYSGQDETLKNIYIKKILIKGEERLSFTYRHKTRDIVKNYATQEAITNVASALNEGFNFATLFTLGFDLQLQQSKNKDFSLKKLPPTKKEIPDLAHDKNKKRVIAAKGKLYLHALKITDAEGNVLKNAQDKYRQINHYIQILGSLIKEMPNHKTTNIVDMGSGKGYLTFALYDYFTNTLNKAVTITGVEFRQDMVDLCNTIAAESKFDGLHFVKGTIEAFDSTGTNILIALHACDTATDDAIAKGIKANADLIVVAPCCHKQIRREIEKNKAHNELDFLTKYGIFLERQAEMVTDGIRALILEYFGYQTKVFEFVSDVHTPKNIMIVGVKSETGNGKRETIVQKIKDAKNYFGIGRHYLENLTPVPSP